MCIQQVEMLLKILWRLYWKIRNYLKIEKIQGQGYDGAANMSGNYKGLLTRILWQNPKVLYLHWQAHCLNLILVESAKSNICPTLHFYGQLIKTELFIYWNAEDAAPRSASTGAEETL